MDRLEQIDRISGALRQLWRANPDKRLCDLLRGLSIGPFEGVSDENLYLWIYEVL